MALFAVLGLHLLCQVVYSLFMWFAIDGWRGRTLWLLFIWLVPIVGIGVAGARFSRGKRGT